MVKTSTVYTTSDGNRYNKKTIANRHQRFLNAQDILTESPDLFDGEGDTPMAETFLDIIKQLGGATNLQAILKDYQLGPQRDEK